MRQISIISGKGGTGKTTVATNLAFVAAQEGMSVVYLDCDVEEPNGDLFLRPNISEIADVELPFPKIDLTRCTFCGECATLCEFRALAVVADNVLLFPELCHSCGACHHLCPEEAIFMSKTYVVTGLSRELMIFDKQKLYEIGGTREDGIRKVLEGVTTLEEVVRVTTG